MCILQHISARPGCLLNPQSLPLAGGHRAGECSPRLIPKYKGHSKHFKLIMNHLELAKAANSGESEVTPPFNHSSTIIKGERNLLLKSNQNYYEKNKIRERTNREGGKVGGHRHLGTVSRSRSSLTKATKIPPNDGSRELPSLAQSPSSPRPLPLAP